MKHLFHKLSSLRLLMLLAALLGMGDSTAWADTTFQRITSTGDLVAGDRYIVVSETNNVAMGTLNSGKGRGISVTITSNTVTIDESTSGVDVFTLGGTTGAYTLRGSKSLAYLGYNSSTNFQTNNSVASDLFRWAITFNGNNAVFQNKSTTDRYIRCYDSGPDFRAYTTSYGSVVQLYKEVTASACATPTFSPTAGAKPYGTEVSINCATVGATIHYTTDNNTPTSSSATYSSAIPITGTVIIKAIAIKDGLGDSEVATATYSVATPTTPTFSPASGTAVYYGTKVTVSSDEGTSIYYTAAASTPSDPDNDSDEYPDGGIAIYSSQTIKAIAYDGGGNASSISSASYTLKNPEKPTFSVTGGGVAEGTKVTLSSATGTTIYYTIDGTTPTSSSTVYSSAITINSDMTIKAIAIDGAGNSSTEASATYHIVGIDLRGMYSGSVTFSPGSYASLTTSYADYDDVTYTGSNSVNYDGWTLTKVLKTSTNLQLQKANGQVALPPVVTDAGFTITVTATTNSVTVSDGTNSGTNTLAVSSTTANITISAVSAYAVISSIEIRPNDGRADAGLEYETAVYSPYLGSSFSTPVLTNPHSLTVSYSSSDEDIATVNSSTGAVTLKDIGSTIITASFAGNATYKSGEASYTLTVLDPDITEAPTFSIAEGAVAYGTTIELSTLTDGATIYYTTDGSTPTSSSSTYTSAITITDAITIQAIAIKSAKSSTVSSADYTIADPIAPTFSVASGKVISGTKVTLTAPTSCVISYTTDGSDPEDLENVTDGNTITFTINVAQTIKAISIDPLANASSEASASYTIAASMDYRSASQVIVYDDFSVLPSAYATAWDGQLKDNLDNTTSGWERTDLIKSSSLLQMKNGSGVLTSPYVLSQAGYTVKVTYGSTAALTLTIGSSNKVGSTGGGSSSQPCTVELTTSDTAIPFTITAGSGTTFVKSIEITPRNVITIGSAGYTTFTPAFNAGFPVGVTGYIATETTVNTVTLEEVSAVPSGTPVVIKGTSGSYALSVENAEDCDDVSSNILLASDGTVTGDDANIFALGKKNGEVGFYLVDSSVTIPAGKAYLDLSGSSVKEFLSFDFGDADTISDVRGKTDDVRGDIFNLAGQRVSKLQRGINIVNGHKVLVK